MKIGICGNMGKQPPAGFFYEMFLDEEGRKISKSVGKGLTIHAIPNFGILKNHDIYQPNLNSAGWAVSYCALQ